MFIFRFDNYFRLLSFFCRKKHLLYLCHFRLRDGFFLEIIKLITEIKYITIDIVVCIFKLLLLLLFVIVVL